METLLAIAAWSLMGTFFFTDYGVDALCDHAQCSGYEYYDCGGWELTRMKEVYCPDGSESDRCWVKFETNAIPFTLTISM